MQKYMNRYKRAQYKLGPTEGSFIFRILTIDNVDSQVLKETKLKCP